MKRVLVLGLGVSGKAAAQYLHDQGFSVVGVDRRPMEMPYPVLLEKDIQDIATFDFLVISPGVPLTHSLVKKAQELKLPVIGEVELALQNVDKALLAVTGTNGKTTVTLLVAHVINHVGISAAAVGNIGEPLTALIDNDSHKVWVVELSSYQLETLEEKKFDAGVILNITPDHLDRYCSMQEYAAAKIRLASCIKDEGKLYLHPQVENEYGSLFATDTVRELYIEEGESLTHDEENQRAAFALVQRFGVSKDEFDEALQTFHKPPHRLEFIDSVQGVNYINDSKGTNIDAVIRAVESLEGPIILLAGGVDKGTPYTPWITHFAGKVKGIALYGEAAPKISKSLSSHFETYTCTTMEKALQRATALATNGDTVLLSPGCSSFDLYRNYEERGEAFRQLVKKLNN